MPDQEGSRFDPELFLQKIGAILDSVAGRRIDHTVVDQEVIEPIDDFLESLRRTGVVARGKVSHDYEADDYAQGIIRVEIQLRLAGSDRWFTINTAELEEAASVLAGEGEARPAQPEPRIDRELTRTGSGVGYNLNLRIRSTAPRAEPHVPEPATPPLAAPSPVASVPEPPQARTTPAREVGPSPAPQSAPGTLRRLLGWLGLRR